MSVTGDELDDMLYGLDITAAGPWGRPDQIAELGALAETCGWDGVFCEDYLSFLLDDQRPDEPVDTYDVWITLALLAGATERMTLGMMVTPLPARKPASVALQALTVDRLSGGRLVLGLGIGDGNALTGNLAALGQEDSPRRRAEVLDESLEVLTRLWSGEPVSYQGQHLRLDGAVLRPRPVAGPRIPIWVGGALTRTGPRRRALRWDGACLYRIPPTKGWEDVTPDDVRRLRADAAARPAGGADFVIMVGGRERANDPDGLAADRRYVAALADAGADWWQEYVPPRLPYDEARRRIVAGPVRPGGK